MAMAKPSALILNVFLRAPKMKLQSLLWTADHPRLAANQEKSPFTTQKSVISEFTRRYNGNSRLTKIPPTC